MAILGSGQYTYEASGENWGKLPEGWFYKEAASVAVDSQDQVYVFNRGNHPMIVLDREGNVLRSWGEGVFANPHGVSVAPDDTLWCVDNSDHSIRHFSPTGKLLNTLAEPNQPAPPLSGRPVNAPTRVAVDPRNGDVLVADGYGNARVHRYSPEGRRLLASWGDTGTGPGEFNIVHDIAIDRDGWIYIADRENRRIQVFDPDGRFEARWSDFSRTAAVHVGASPTSGAEELVYVGEYFGGQVSAYHKAQRLGPRVSILDRRGQVLARLGDLPYGAEPGRFWAPHAIATDSRGDIYVAEVSYAEFGRHLSPPSELRSLQKLVRQG